MDRSIVLVATLTGDQNADRVEGTTSAIQGPKISFVESLDKAIATDQASKGNDFYPLRPSSAGKCARALAYELAEFKGVGSYPKKAMDAHVVRLMDLGHGVEFSVFRQFDKCKDFKVKYKQQVVTLFKLDPIGGVEQPLIEGSIDAIFVGPDFKTVVDIKSQKDKFDVSFKTKWDETLASYDQMASLKKISENGWWAESLPDFLNESGDPFLADNFLQLNSYLHSSFCKERGVTSGSIIKYCKNDSRMYEIRFAPSLELFEYVKEKFTAVNYAIETQQNPELVTREYIHGHIKCAFCPYSAVCWGGAEDPLKAYFKTFPKKKWPTDTDRMENGAEIEALFSAFQKVENAEEDKAYLEQMIVKTLMDAKVQKIKLANKDVYMLKSLKDGIVLRRTKL